MLTNLGIELAAVVTSGELKTALTGRSTKGTGKPYCRYYDLGGSVESVASGGGSASDWWDLHRFGIDIMGDFASSKVISQAETDFNAAIEAVITRLEDNWNIGGGDDVIENIDYDTSDEQTGDGTILLCAMVVTIKTFRSYT